MINVCAIVHEKTSKQNSNCKVTINEKQIILSDETVSPPFIQKQDFDYVYTDFNEITQMKSTSNFRIISLFNHNSILSFSDVKQSCLNFVQQFYSNKSEPRPIGISLGRIAKDYVIDYLSLQQSQKKFEMIETYHISEMHDLVECGLERLRKFSSFPFVLRIGNDPFFEWVIIPNVDGYIPTPSMNGLPPNYQLIFVLNHLLKMDDEIFQRCINKSLVLRLISDSFDDVNTIWACHFSQNSRFSQNASLINAVSTLMNNKDIHFNTYKNDIFVIPKEEETIITQNYITPEINEYSYESVKEQEINETFDNSNQFPNENNYSSDSSPKEEEIKSNLINQNEENINKKINEVFKKINLRKSILQTTTKATENEEYNKEEEKSQNKKEFNQIKIFNFRLRKTVEDKNVTEKELTKYEKNLENKLRISNEKIQILENEIKEMTKITNEMESEHEKNQKDIKILKSLYLKKKQIHEYNKSKINSSKKIKPEFQIAISCLLDEIKNVKNSIASLKSLTNNLN